MLEQLGMNAAGAAVDNTIGLIAGGVQARRQMKNQRKLMAEQLGIDKLKMEEQRKIQMQMWRDTNYAAQVEELKKAGLSIGLMYGKGGAGGATTGAGATGVSAPSAPTGMGLQGGSQLAAQLANIELTKAQTENVKADTERKLGVDKTKVETEIGSLIETTNNTKIQGRLMEIDEDLKGIELEIKDRTKEDTINAIGQQIQLSNQQINWWVRKNKIDEATMEKQIEIISQKALKLIAETELIGEQKNLTKQEIEESKARANKMAEDIAQGWKRLSIEEKNALSNYMNSLSNARTSHAAQINAESNHTNAMTAQERLAWEKLMNDIPASIKEISSIFQGAIGAGILKGIIGGGEKRQVIGGFRGQK